MLFAYEAMDGMGREIKSVIEAVDENDANRKIRLRGYFVTMIRACESDLHSTPNPDKAPSEKSPSEKAPSDFEGQIRALLEERKEINSKLDQILGMLQ